MQRVTLKTSTIFISKGNHTRVYRSVGEIPQSLRQELEQSTNGFNSATILIADRRGREEVRRALAGMPSALRTRLTPSLEPKAPELVQAAESSFRDSFVRAHWKKAVLTLAAGAAAWIALTLR